MKQKVTGVGLEGSSCHARTMNRPKKVLYINLNTEQCTTNIVFKSAKSARYIYCIKLSVYTIIIKSALNNNNHLIVINNVALIMSLY